MHWCTLRCKFYMVSEWRSCFKLFVTKPNCDKTKLLKPLEQLLHIDVFMIMV